MFNQLLSRYWLLVPTLALIVVLLDRVEEPDIIETEETIDMRQTQSDYYLSDFRTQKFDDAGKLQYIVNGYSLAHYPEDDSSEIVNPSIELRRDETSWIIRSEKGRFENAQALFTLNGNVTMIRQSPLDNTEPVLIKTESISIATESNLVHTDEPISIVSPTWSLSATGLRSAIDQGTLSLLSSVRGRYELPSADVQD